MSGAAIGRLLVDYWLMGAVVSGGAGGVCGTGTGLTAGALVSGMYNGPFCPHPASRARMDKTATRDRSRTDFTIRITVLGMSGV